MKNYDLNGAIQRTGGYNRWRKQFNMLDIS